jgi:hypothetical protein
LRMSRSRLRLALFKGPNRVGGSHLRTEADSVFETSCLLSSNYLESGRWTKSENPLILCFVHHRQNPIESTNITSEHLLSVRDVIRWQLAYSIALCPSLCALIWLLYQYPVSCISCVLPE